MHEAGLTAKLGGAWPIGPIARAAQPERAGLSRAQLRNGVTHGLLLRLHHGVYLRAGEWSAAKPWEQELLRLESHRLSTRNGSLYSHVSAARFHGCWVYRSDRRVHLTIPYRAASRNFGNDVAAHHRRLPAQRICSVPGGQGNQFRVTDLTQTVVDCARLLPAEEAVVIGDSALRLGLQREQAEQLLLLHPRAHGTNRARVVLAALDARSESAGESRTRWLLADWPIEQPELQFEIATRSGTFRVDFAWRELRLVLEFDRKTKYFDFDSTGAVLYQERRRERALQEAGWQVLRIEWADLGHPEQLYRRVLSAMERAAELTRRLHLFIRWRTAQSAPMAMLTIRRSGSAAPQSNWSPTVNALM